MVNGDYPRLSEGNQRLVTGLAGGEVDGLDPHRACGACRDKLRGSADFSIGIGGHDAEELHVAR